MRFHNGTGNSSRSMSRPLWNRMEDRKSTRLNSSHLVISYAVFCLKKKKKKQREEVSGNIKEYSAYIHLTVVHTFKRLTLVTPLHRARIVVDSTPEVTRLSSTRVVR